MLRTVMRRRGLTEIPMIVAWNLYQGWYEPDINEFPRGFSTGLMKCMTGRCS